MNNQNNELGQQKSSPPYIGNATVARLWSMYRELERAKASGTEIAEFDPRQEFVPIEIDSRPFYEKMDFYIRKRETARKLGLDGKKDRADVHALEADTFYDMFMRRYEPVEHFLDPGKLVFYSFGQEFRFKDNLAEVLSWADGSKGKIDEITLESCDAIMNQRLAKAAVIYRENLDEARQLEAAGNYDEARTKVAEARIVYSAFLRPAEISNRRTDRKPGAVELREYLRTNPVKAEDITRIFPPIHDTSPI